MVSLRAHSSAEAVLSYYKLSEYYVKAEGAAREGGAVWQGQGAERLGLSGAVGRNEFESLLRGRLPDGTQLGTVRNGQLEHRPSWDLTFSAPKSVSVMALVGEDSRLLAAHDQAVRAALAYVEARVAETRIRENGKVHAEATGNLVIATLREDTSRSGDPQLHSHNVVINATQSRDGQWRSLDGYRFFEVQREVGQLYRNELALRAQALGYEVLRGKNGTFELANVPQAVIDTFSNRSAAVEQALSEQGLTRETATPAQKDAATLATRGRKSEQTADQLRGDWQARAGALGFDARDAAQAARQTSQEAATAQPERFVAAGALAVASAAAKLAERDAVFSDRDLRVTAMQLSVGRAGLADIERAIGAAERRGELIARTQEHDGRKQEGFTTREAIRTEWRMLGHEQTGRGAVAPLLSREEAHRAVARAELSGAHPWTPGQRTATAALLSSRDQVTALQGYAGTAKTTTVVRTLADEAQRQGYTVTALAPTASAADTLGKATGLEAQTVSRHLAGLGKTATDAAGSTGPAGKSLWIVDEASMLSAKQTEQLLHEARKADARVLLIGDVQQLGSVEAGAAFRQLQQHGMRTAVLDEIVRQSNPLARDAVYAAIQGDARTALAAIERSGGQVREIADTGERYRAIAQDYAALAPEQRAKTLLLDGSREGRERLTDAVRDLLKQDGTIQRDGLRVETLESKGHTREDAKHTQSYDIGDRVRFRQDYAAGVAKGTYYTVAGTDQKSGTVHLQADDGRRIDWQPQRWGSGQVEAYAVVSREVSVGDRIAWTRNEQSQGRINGHTAEVVGVRDGSLQVKDAKGIRTLDLVDPGNHHFRHAYVQTVHAAQGQTADRVMINAESFRTFLLNAQSFYVSISRAREVIQIYTDNLKDLIRGIEERSGEKATALRESQGTASRDNSGAARGTQDTAERGADSRHNSSERPRASESDSTGMARDFADRDANAQRSDNREHGAAKANQRTHDRDYSPGDN